MRGSHMRVEKRSLVNPASTNEPVKRRAPYAPRACDVCRRRKGRCDGQKPCEYCHSRAMDCCYSDGNALRHDSQNHDDQALDNVTNDTQTHDSQAHLMPSTEPDGSAPQAPRAPQEPAVAWTPEALSTVIANMQVQLNALMTHARIATEAQSPERPRTMPTPVSNSLNNSVPPGPGAKTSLTAPSPTADIRLRSSVRRFYGPTSPDYSLNAALIRLEQRNSNDSGTEIDDQRVPGIVDSQSDDEDPTGGADSSDAVISSNNRRRQALSKLRTLLSKPEATRLLYVYQDAIGEIHPICDIASLVEQTEAFYNTSDTDAEWRSYADPLNEENNLLIVNLAISIALLAESGSQSELGKALFESCRDLINAKLAAPATGIKSVTVVLLAGFYHYFGGCLTLAWRMCGSAGRMAMELGLHSGVVSRHYPESDRRRAEVITISCSLAILDRQWSAAAGLPPHFQESVFELAQASLVQSPYLKAMMTFTLMSYKFNEPISRAANGGSCEDDDAFEVTNIQIEQWRKKALEEQGFVHPRLWHSMATMIPLSWTTMLYLRANAVRIILLRSLFLSTSNRAACRCKVQPALELISDSINVISILDHTTDVYRKQHPLFQHFLASACALLFLIIAYTNETGAASSTNFPVDFADSINRNFMKALSLSSSYSNLSQSSHKLWKRLASLRETLCHMDILSREEAFGALGNAVSRTDQTPPFQNQASSGFMDRGSNKHQLASPSTSLNNSMMYETGFFGDTRRGLDNADSLGVGAFDKSMSLFDPLLFQWPLAETDTFFSEAGF
ncbi:hypothetical protein BGZ61DRAFT_535619 [Ilyonectria robusta]|uniref:uncharacterized protein n=1 Tax=Ilyonectria robusta TaxID=1079257 RepID=UPI001E8E919A|nr:uncharacterized protein BGZ61DRAFT_535619 [Ilyonectria robusta]KAH8679199.1 hypothetical protein BGZ61DRAFT_535619 [Ilyonectria robusta]